MLNCGRLKTGYILFRIRYYFFMPPCKSKRLSIATIHIISWKFSRISRTPIPRNILDIKVLNCLECIKTIKFPLITSDNGYCSSQSCLLYFVSYETQHKNKATWMKPLQAIQTGDWWSWKCMFYTYSEVGEFKMLPRNFE